MSKTDVYAKFKEHMDKIREDGVKEAKERSEKRQKLADKYELSKNKLVQNYLEMQTMRDFRNAMKPRQEKIRDDFQNLYTFDDDIYGTPNADDSNVRTPVSECEKMAKSRIGVAEAIAQRIPDDAFKDWLFWKKIDSNQDEKTDMTKHMLKWQLKVDFYNKWAEAGGVANWAGIAFIVIYWPRSKDKAFSGSSPDYSQPPPTDVKPNRLQVFDPIRMTPINITDTKMLDYDEEVWEFSGGMYGNASRIHRDRVHPIILRHYPGDYRGLSIYDPIRMTLLLNQSIKIQ